MGSQPTPLLASDRKEFSSFSEWAPALLNRGKGGPDLHSSSRQGGTRQQADSSVPFSQALSSHSALLPSFVSVCVCVVSSLGLLAVLCHSPCQGLQNDSPHSSVWCVYLFSPYFSWVSAAVGDHDGHGGGGLGVGSLPDGGTCWEGWR